MLLAFAVVQIPVPADAGIIASCDATPRTGCKTPVFFGRSGLRVVDKTPDTKDLVVWKWRKGEDTAFGELGDPVSSDGYALCLYDGTTSLILESQAPAGGLCAGVPCWKITGSILNPKGYKYNDRNRTPDGLTKIIINAGAESKAKITVKGKGENVRGATVLDPMPTPPLTLPVTAQVQSSTGECWETVYTTALKNVAGEFKAK